MGGTARNALGTGMYRIEVRRDAQGALTAELTSGETVLQGWTVQESRTGATRAYSAKGFWLEVTGRKAAYRPRSRHTPRRYRRFRGVRGRLVEAAVGLPKKRGKGRWKLDGLRLVCRRAAASAR